MGPEIKQAIGVAMLIVSILVFAGYLDYRKGGWRLVKELIGFILWILIVAAWVTGAMALIISN